MDGNESKDDFEFESNSDKETMVNLMIGDKRLQLIMQEEHEHVTQLKNQILNDLIRL